MAHSLDDVNNMLKQKVSCSCFLETVEMYFSESLEAYKAALGLDHSQTINALEDFSKWLVHVGKREVR